MINEMQNKKVNVVDHTSSARNFRWASFSFLAFSTGRWRVLCQENGGSAAGAFF